MQLTPRLETIFREIAPGETAADIGTDHGYIPIFLKQKEISEKVILTDISSASLEKAVKNAERAGISDGLIFRTGDGLGPVGPSEVDDIIIAGVGGELMVSMLAEDLPKSRTFKKYVFQPRSKAGTLRRFLAENGFFIAREQLAEERGRICQVITALPERYDGRDPEKAERIRKEYAGDSEIFGRYPEAGAGDIEWEAPVTLLHTREGLAEEFFLARLEKEKTKLAGIAGKKEYDGKIMSEAAGNTAYLRRLLAGTGADGE
ncbi:MAG: class I SAM-dependent methyltransferase [Anaerovoracaceae bacterium]|jgi:tRNA A22 N-methylase